MRNILQTVVICGLPLCYCSTSSSMGLDRSDLQSEIKCSCEPIIVRAETADDSEKLLGDDRTFWIDVISRSVSPCVDNPSDSTQSDGYPEPSIFPGKQPEKSFSAPLPPFSSLGFLSVNHEQIQSLRGLPSFFKLWSLDLSHNQIQTLESSAILPNLAYLSLNYNKIQSLRGLQGLSSLAYLSVAYNQVKSLEGLQDLPNLSHLYLDYNSIQSVDGLQGLTNLWELGLSYNQIHSLREFPKLTTLAFLHIDHNQIPRKEVIELSKKMSYCKIISDFGVFKGGEE